MDNQVQSTVLCCLGISAPFSLLQTRPTYRNVYSTTHSIGIWSLDGVRTLIHKTQFNHLSLLSNVHIEAILEFKKEMLKIWFLIFRNLTMLKNKGIVGGSLTSQSTSILL
uniref:Ovule protein n=1 Tax=Heterorhabditis bacteriophora TaxID=37862 RepID=A0A1I7WAN0_HETBA